MLHDHSFIFLTGITGAGKTTKLIDLANQLHNEGKKVLFIMENHAIINEFLSEFSKNRIWIYGKGLVCSKKENHVYYPPNPCSKCKTKNVCNYPSYISQCFSDMTHKNHIVVTVPHLFHITHSIYRPDVVIIDESITSFSFEIFRVINKNQIFTDEDYFSHLAYNKKRQIVDEVLNHFAFFRRIDPKNSKLIYSASHTSLKIVEKIFGKLPDLHITITSKIRPEVTLINEKGTIKAIEKLIPKIPYVLEFLNIPDSDETLLICKKMFVDEIKKFCNCNITHYGALSVGTNRFEKCKYILLFGRIFPNTLQQVTLRRFAKKMGLNSKDLIQEFVISTHHQAIGRIRGSIENGKKVYILFRSFDNRSKIALLHKNFKIDEQIEFDLHTPFP